MTLALPDTSTWARSAQPEIAVALADAIEADEIVVIEPVVLELLRSARDARDLEVDAVRYGFLRTVPMSRRIERRARAVQARLARRGYHRGPSPVDLLVAAAAESVDAEVWHCDRHFELIAEVTRQPLRRLGA